ncbi:MAG: sigma 54-interacting transcriptional regulator [Fuerstiella sp.]|nr:sigma 54-interacting transcriptional regulator [Fuerstiella sp.]
MTEMSNDETNHEAFLLSWDGTTWRDVVRLRQGQVVTVGRSAANKLVLHDDACSRNHCEVFHSAGDWKVRDLDSRNGTLVNEQPVSGDLTLRLGDVVCIGQCRLAFTTSLDAQPSLPDEGNIVAERETSVASYSTAHEEPPILHRSIVPQFLAAEDNLSLHSNHEQEIARLYRLGLEMGAAESRQQLTEVVLQNLAAETVADISAVLLVRPDAPESVAPADLLVVAYDSRKDLPYRRVSDNLSRVVLSSREALLARDIEDDQQLAVFDSLGEMRAISVICAPIHCDDRVRGLVHLYATNPDNALDKHDLEYTLAVARQLALALDHLAERDALKSGLAQAKNVNKSLRQHFDSEFKLIGDSAAMTDLREKIVLIAETHANVLIRGESGCGKELIARNIHFSSPRREGPFVCLNCAALNENLLESELFGHEKGAFTGASDRKIGRFEQAHQGTLFLDEVGEMSTAIQAKFLRVLEGHSFERIGGRKPIDVDVRIVAATNKDLEEAVEGGDFRKDLYFRLHVAELIARPLRERPDDIPHLADFFLQKFVEKTGRVISGYTEDARKLLASYDWPGNVRELQNTIERTVILCRNEVIRGTDVQLSSFSSRLSSQATLPPTAANYHEMSLGDVERDHILATLDFTDWNKSQAAQILGIERSTLDRKLKRYHVSRPE